MNWYILGRVHSTGNGICLVHLAGELENKPAQHAQCSSLLSMLVFLCLIAKDIH